MEEICPTCRNQTSQMRRRNETQPGERSNNNGFDWLALPEEVILQIFTNLTFFELSTTIRLVCKEWNRVSHHPYLLKSRGRLIWERSNQKGVLNDTLLMNLQMRNDMSKVSKLDLRNQVLMTDHGLRAALIFSPFVTFLNVSGCFTLGDSSMITIGKLRTLQHLNISGCFRLTDMGIKILCQMPPEISHLNVSKCSYLSDASLFFIGESLSDSLTVLGANHLERVTDKGIEQLTRSAVKLKQLDLRECPHVTDMSCLFLAASVLQSLTLDGCSVTSKGLQMLQRHCKTMRHLSATSSFITLEAVN